MHISSSIAGWAALGLLAPICLGSALAGSLDKCDQARLAGRRAVLRIYESVLADLNARLAEAQADGADPTNVPFRDAHGTARVMNFLSLRQNLENEEATDVGRADRRVASGCRDENESIEHLSKIAEDVARLGISAVLSKHAADVDLSRKHFVFGGQ